MSIWARLARQSTRSKADRHKNAGWFRRRRSTARPPRTVYATSKAKPLIISLTGNLDLRLAPRSTMRELRKLDPGTMTFMRPTHVVVDIASVTGLDPGAFLILSSQINRLRLVRNIANLSGNFPANPLVRRMMLDANFLGLQRQVSGPEKAGEPCLRHEFGNPATTDLRKLGKSIQEFVKNAAPWLDTTQRAMTYTAVVECVENVLKHAYTSRDTAASDPAWEVVGFHNPNGHVACIAVLDRGVGIAKTVRTHATEFLDVLDPIRTTAHFIRVAASGKRTHSLEGSHGKGLSALRKLAEANDSFCLQILTADAAVTWAGSAGWSADSVSRLDGTLVCLYLTPADGSMSR